MRVEIVHATAKTTNVVTQIYLFGMFSFFTQAVKPLVYIGITVRKGVQLIVETMCVIYRRGPAMDVLQDGLTQLVTEV